MKKQPHLLLFNPDQMRADALGHLGNGSGATPNLDRFVESEAVSFNAAFCQNPVCTPSRCSFMTGWYPHVRGHRTMYHMLHHERSEPNLQRILKDNGYHVWWTARNDLIPGQFGYKEDCDVHFIAGKEDFKRWGHYPRVDHQFQLIIEALKEKGIYEDTAIFFFSDHGDFTGDYGLVEKTQNTFEDCLTRVPFIFRPPRDFEFKAGIRQAMIELIDFPATVYELTGIDPGYDHFGRSLLPLLAEEDKEHREAVFCEGGRRYGEEQAMEKESLRGDRDPRETPYWPRLSLQITDDGPFHGKAAMCRTERYKYVRRLYEQDELYDLETDPQELCNLIEDPARGQTLTELKEKMADWYMKTCDVVPYETDKRL